MFAIAVRKKRSRIEVVRVCHGVRVCGLRLRPRQRLVLSISCNTKTGDATTRTCAPHSTTQPSNHAGNEASSIKKLKNHTPQRAVPAVLHASHSLGVRAMARNCPPPCCCTMNTMNTPTPICRHSQISRVLPRPAHVRLCVRACLVARLRAVRARARALIGRWRRRRRRGSASRRWAG